MSSSGPRRGGSSSRIANLALAGASLLFTFAVLEIGVRAVVDFERHKPSGVYDVDPASGGLAFLPGSVRRYETSEFHFDARYNAFGRRDVEWPPRVVADPANVLVIGDSLTYGIGVEHPDTIPSVLEQRFARAGRPVEVLNFGMPGNLAAPPGYARMLDDAIERDFGARSVVVVIFVGNDFYPGVLASPEARPAEPARAGERGGAGPLARWKTFQFLKLRVSQSARLVGWAFTLGRWLGVNFYDSAGTYVFLRERTPEQEQTFQRILAHVGDMKRRCDETGRRLFAVVLPNRIQVENREALNGSVYEAARPGRDVLRYCQEIGIACLDLLPALSEAWEREREPLFYPIDRHPNRRGYRLIGDAVADFLLAEGVPAPG